MIRRMLVSLGLVLVLATAAVGTVGADPLNAKGAEPFPVVCGGQTLMIVVNGRGDFTPGHIIGSTGNLIPQAFVFNITISDAQGNVIDSDTETVAKGGQRRGLQDSLTTCTFGQSFTDPDTGMTFTFSGTATTFSTPRGR